jgi:hypothetical protein
VLRQKIIDTILSTITFAYKYMRYGLLTARQETKEQIVEWLLRMDKSVLDIVKNCEYSKLHKFHLGLGMTIRNTFGFWHSHPLTKNWRENPVSRDGVDHSLDHPDAVSMDIIRMLWKELNKK